MSRIIKFRVRSEDQKTYGYKFPYNSIGDFYVNTRGKVFSDFGNTVAPEVRQDAFIIEQYTGLKDKNGKEIYEGDIVRWVDDYDENAYINFDEGCFWVNWPINSERINGDMVDDLEVIGNIHENPELLGGEE